MSIEHFFVIVGASLAGAKAAEALRPDVLHVDELAGRHTVSTCLK